MADSQIVLMKSEPMKLGNSVEDKTLMTGTQSFRIVRKALPKYGKLWTKDNHNNVIGST